MRTKCERRKLTFKKRLNRKASFVSREAGSISDCLANYEERGSSVLETPTQKTAWWRKFNKDHRNIKKELVNQITATEEMRS